MFLLPMASTDRSLASLLAWLGRPALISAAWRIRLKQDTRDLFVRFLLRYAQGLRQSQARSRLISNIARAEVVIVSCASACRPRFSYQFAGHFQDTKEDI